MTKEKYLSMAEQKYEDLQALGHIDNFYDYEKEFEKIFNDLGRAVLQENISKVPADRRKKKRSQNMDPSKYARLIPSAKGSVDSK